MYCEYNVIKSGYDIVVDNGTNVIQVLTRLRTGNETLPEIMITQSTYACYVHQVSVMHVMFTRVSVTWTARWWTYELILNWKLVTLLRFQIFTQSSIDDIPQIIRSTDKDRQNNFDTMHGLQSIFYIWFKFMFTMYIWGVIRACNRQELGVKQKEV